MENKPSCKSFYYISAGKNINFIVNNNDKNKNDNIIVNVDSSNSNDDADNTQSSFYVPRLNLNKTKQRFSLTNLLNRIFQKFEYISLNKNRKFTILEHLCETNVFFYRTFTFNGNEEKKF